MGQCLALQGGFELDWLVATQQIDGVLLLQAVEIAR
jgi:hypothetical protein